MADRFLFMSAGAFRAEEQAFVAQSPHAVIDKPFDSELLRRVIRERIALAESGQPGK